MLLLTAQWSLERITTVHTTLPVTKQYQVKYLKHCYNNLCVSSLYGHGADCGCGRLTSSITFSGHCGQSPLESTRPRIRKVRTKLSTHTGSCCNPNLPFSEAHSFPGRWLNPNRVKSLGLLKWQSPRPHQRSTCPAGKLCNPSKDFLAGSTRATGLNEQYGANTAVYVDRAERGVLKIEISTKFITLCGEPFDTPPFGVL